MFMKYILYNVWAQILFSFQLILDSQGESTAFGKRIFADIGDSISGI